MKLEDRLFYVLQPSLETLIADSSLAFPFVPFAYQFEGVAFLYPRVAAVLADEMGLGKTMQAITAIRLLIHAGEVRSVLLVCPKPLVTNWQREFALWAPELPVAVIEGEQVKRLWQWRLDRRPDQNRQLRSSQSRSAAGGRSGAAVRSRGARRIAADQKSPRARRARSCARSPAAAVGP